MDRRREGRWEGGGSGERDKGRKRVKKEGGE